MYVNRIAEILESRGIGHIRPTESQLGDMGITIHVWNKWVRKTSDPELGQLEDLSDFLECTIGDLVAHKKEAVL